MLAVMADTTRITVTLPTEQVAELRKITDNVSGYVAEAVARQLRHRLLGADLLHHQEEHGAFTEEELAEARSRIFGAADADGPAADADGPGADADGPGADAHGPGTGVRGPASAA
ncbi:hypothetical protein H340_23273 [Streptomyces mobaraensis NBRC 13819 = DSM 40847]|uniref:Post-segregation antitoxin CcdA n=1 Tax=Streptomyces mobaraensis (strain ATCC 29032 / DSM 40847 / JCM 4168 / NBRC 13819 / NCIMB 11159 / IPCR 16-22) TaxID=1223523 RepID=M3C256_STRM1|nr:hypothetical protein H340_23273 [Streptomyces mobaraensis NBRC 13819 = DSM 40847]